ncbi:MAG: NapH/MauN family ferredoxin-type protein [Campylobacteraceae bacterium]
MDKYKTRSTIEKTPFLSTFISTNKNGKKRLNIRFFRWISIISINLLFVLSYRVDFQVLEGSLSGSRFFGFHLIDPFISLQMLLAHHSLYVNLVIGTLTILVFYFFVGGRAFCSWVCPYNILGEISEKIHRYLIGKKLIKSHEFNNKIRYIFWAIFLFFAFFAGYLVFEIINPVGILSRFIVYGWSLAIVFVLTLFLFETFVSQRAWCRYVCPLGVTYSFLGWASVTKIKWTDKCDHCNVCTNVCMVPHVLKVTKDKDNTKSEVSIMSGDCTLCGRCVEVCHTDALSYETKLKKLI